MKTRSSSSAISLLFWCIISSISTNNRIINNVSSLSLSSITTTTTTTTATSMTVPNTGTNTNTNTNRRPVQYMDAITVAQKIWKDSYLFETDIHAIIRCGGNNNEAEEDDKEDDNKQSSSPSLSLPLPLPLPLPRPRPQFHLAYMPMRNRGEIIRLMLEESGCSYDLEIIGFKNWAEAVVVEEEEEESNTCGGVKATTPQGKCPVLRNYDGKNNDLGQEGAITRYLANELNLSGINSIEEAEVDSLYCFWFSTMRNNGISHDGEHFSIASLRDAEPTNDRPRYQDIFRLNTLSKAERSLMALGYFEEQLDKSGSGYLLSSGLTYIDFGLFYILFELAEEDNVPDFALKFNLPKLGLFLESIQNRSKIKDYIISPSRMPRYKRDTDGTSLYTYIEGKGSPRR